MRLQMQSDELARLNFPRTMSPPPRLAPPPPAEGSPPVPMPAARVAHRRAWLARLTGTVQRVRPRPHSDPVLTLVHRITQGFTLAEYEHARSLGFEGYLEEQLDHLSIDDSAMEALLPHFKVLPMSPKQIFNYYDGRRPGTESSPIDAVRQFKTARVARAIGSRRQLFERMCEFWLDHFNVDHNKDIEWLLLPEFERNVIRRHALGSFPAMLSACAFSGAMLYYLDNWLNVRGAPQNNYARELLELHTMGVHGGYNETDVNEVAKCFTGWTLNGNESSPAWLRAVFEPELHSRGPKLVLGHVIASGPPVGQPGEPVVRNDARDVLEILAAHRSTAEFLARKLIRRFLTPEPPEDLVEQVADTYLATDGDIKSMLRVILTRENLSPDSTRLAPKYRRPFHYMTSLLRALDGSVWASQSTMSLQQLVAMGHSPYDFELPTGYPEDFQDWGDSLLPRWNFAATLLRSDQIFGGVELTPSDELQDKLGFHGPDDRPGLAQRMNVRLFGQTLSLQEVGVLQEYIDGYPVEFDEFALYDCLVLAATLPGFQWH